MTPGVSTASQPIGFISLLSWPFNLRPAPPLIPHLAPVLPSVSDVRFVKEEPPFVLLLNDHKKIVFEPSPPGFTVFLAQRTIFELLYCGVILTL